MLDIIRLVWRRFLVFFVWVLWCVALLLVTLPFWRELLRMES